MTSPDGVVGKGVAALTSAVYTNGFRSLQSAARSTGFRTHPFRHESAGLDADPRTAETFLVNSRLRRRDAEFEASVGIYLSEAGGALNSVIDRRPPADQDVALPAVKPLPMALGVALAKRRSVRSYTGEPITMADLSQLVAATSGITSTDEHYPFRSTASAGGLYPIELMLVAQRVRGLDVGVYSYLPRTHSLDRRGDVGMATGIEGAMAVSPEVLMWDRSAILCLFVATPWRSMRKYGPRGMRHAFHEAGAMSQNLHLAATALGLGSVDCSSVYDDEVHDVLGLDGVHTALAHVVVVGAKE